MRLPKWFGNLKKEIIIALLVKLALLMLIKIMFFSHPMTRSAREKQLQQLIASPGASEDSIYHHGDSK